jgi:hypothetical protein
MALRHDPTYRTWGAMITRCTNPKVNNYADYGGRGITVCERWRTFENFLADMGVRPQGRTIERLDNEKGYEPGNCAWTTPKDQARNRRDNCLLTHDGRTQTLSAWAEQLGISKEALRARLHAGWPVERIVAAPARRQERAGMAPGKRLLTYNGETRSLAEWARHLGIPDSRLRDRIVKLGWPVEKALSK